VAAPKRNWLSEITREAKPRPTAAILYGVPGVGKTSMAAHIPDVVFLVEHQEDGINALKQAGLVPDVPQLPPVQTWQETLDVLEALATVEHNHRALAVDALGGFETMCHAHVCQREFNGDWGKEGFEGYKRGAEVSLPDLRQFIVALDRLRTERSMSIFLLGHAKVAPFKNPEGPDYDRYACDINHKSWSLFSKWADIVMFANYEVSFAAKDESKAKAKAKGGQTRMLYTEHHAAFDAKNRHGLPSEIEMGDSGADAWNNFKKALQNKGNN
jgi:hypothetical protein